ncbi:MAG TPA: nickel pincer cofactor biosynthesis protein LarC [Nocardioidaceae bacterium]|nr:nickel pincer cofactor biosynthesis protein LarC [Nocardioidaceae bacterium]
MIGWLDCSSGASGDMLLGALVGVGVPLATIDAAVQAVAPEPIRVSAEPVTRGGLTATRVQVEVKESETHRGLSDIRTLLEAAPLDDRVRARAIDVFTRLATAEAAVHGTTVDEVHFHEVGALDAIADVVGACAGLIHLGIDSLTSSTIAVGSGSTGAAHGRLPVPPPAVAELLRGVPSVGGPAERELCTPTGAALVTTWASAYGSQPPMRVEAIGVGAGGQDLAGHANVLRLFVGEAVEPSHVDPDGRHTQLLLETNVDDLDPRLWPAVLDRILAAGAADAWLTPILMKKGRPAHTLSVLTDAACRADVLAIIFAETTTIGLRERTVGKVALDREMRTVDVGGRSIRVKLARHEGIVVNAQPEYEDVVAAATALGRPVKAVLADAVAAIRMWS